MLIKELFRIILDGDKEESRKAARDVRKVLYASGNDSEKSRDIKSIIESAEENYRKITEPWRVENYIVAFSVIYFLRDDKARPDFLFRWFYELLVHENGVVRYAAVRMFETEFGPLTVHVRFPDEEYGYLERIRNDGIIYETYDKLFELSESLSKPSYRRIKYLNSLPTGPYKSVQMVLSSLVDLCGEDYILQIEDRYMTLN